MIYLYHILVVHKTGGANKALPLLHRRFSRCYHGSIRYTSRKLSTLTYPVTYLPAGVFPQYSALVVTR